MASAFLNGKIYTGESLLSNKVILVNNGQITGIVNSEEVPVGYERKDLSGLNIAPAFIDIQIYGGNGLMFSQELSIAALQATYEYCLEGGAAHFLITMATNSVEKFFRGIEVVRGYWDSGGKGLIGLHLEGPYLNPIKKGAHLERYIKKPSIKEVSELLERGKGIVKMMTLAPEMCDQAVIDLLLKNDVIVSAGHTNATYKEAINAFNKGIPVATHLFNAMSAFQSREPGMVGAIYDHKKIKSSIVCDGIHVDYVSVRISKRIMKERLFFITDAVTEVMEGEYHHIFKGDRYTLPDGTLSGSSLTMMKCVKNAIQYVGITMEESLRMAATYQAELLGESCGLGKIEKGYKACFVVFDDLFNIREVYC